MKPLNYAILLHFTKVKEACADDVINALKKDYGNYKGLGKAAVIESIMTAEANGLVEESRFDLDDKGEVRVYYHATEESAAIITKLIG